MIFPLLGFFITLLLVFFIFKKTLRIKRWQKSLNLKEHARTFQELYQDSNGFILSQQARQKQDALEYTYGEINFLPFIALLSLTKIDNKTVFYDLGSGIGKAVLACAIVYPVEKSVGVELFPELYLASCKQAEELTAIKNYSFQAKKIQFILGDFLAVDLTEATLIFINATAFFGSTWDKLCTKLESLPNLDIVITTSRTIHSNKFSLLRQTKVEMSWGVVFAYTHKRKKIFANRLENIE